MISTTNRLFDGSLPLLTALRLTLAPLRWAHARQRVGNL